MLSNEEEVGDTNAVYTGSTCNNHVCNCNCISCSHNVTGLRAQLHLLKPCGADLYALTPRLWDTWRHVALLELLKPQDQVINVLGELARREITSCRIQREFLSFPIPAHGQRCVCAAVQTDKAHRE